MLPSNLKAEQFAAYPPEARRLATAHLQVLQQLPLSFLPGLLRELIDYDFKFPAERASIDRELIKLSALSPTAIQAWFQAFSKLSLSSTLETFDWVNYPAQFVEQESAHLWTSHQLDSYRKAATDYGDRLRAAAPAEPLPLRRLGIAIIGQGVDKYDGQLFRNLRKYGTCFRQLKPESGLDQLLAAAADRAKAHPIPYSHWYVDGGQSVDHNPTLTLVQYRALEPVRNALLSYMEKEIARPGMGPEELRTRLARLLPTDLGMDKAGDPVLDRFQVRLFTEGSGTQIFSTAFTQWTARECLRRAQPLTLVVRYAPRQLQRPMNELLCSGHADDDLDPTGSLIDGDMGAYYQWINQQRLPGSDQSSFVVWFEGHGQALAIGPSLPRGAESNSDIDLAKLLSLAIS